MESTSKVESPMDTTEKIVRAPGVAETVTVEGEKGRVVQAGSLVVETTKDAGRDVAKTDKRTDAPVVSTPKPVATEPAPTAKPGNRDARPSMSAVSPTPPTRAVEPTDAAAATKTP
jgi:hypothetical protein